jgi:hypothetical protein
LKRTDTAYGGVGVYVVPVEEHGFDADRQRAANVSFQRITDHYDVRDGDT